MQYKTPQDLWPGLEEKHAAEMFLMNWQPSREFSHAILRTEDVNDENSVCSYGVPYKHLRECAAALLAAADWLERKRAEWLKENTHHETTPSLQNPDRHQ